MIREVDRSWLKLLPSSYIEKLKSKHAAQHANRSHSGTSVGTGEDVGASHGASDLYQSPMYERLRRAIAWAVERRYAVIGATLGALLLAGAGMTLVQQQFFPTASVWADPSSASELATLKTNLDSYVTQGQLAFITGSKNIDTDWDAFVKGLDGVGMKRYLELNQQAYDKYKAGK